jgi:hypothetical protein
MSGYDTPEQGALARAINDWYEPVVPGMESSGSDDQPSQTIEKTQLTRVFDGESEALLKAWSLRHSPKGMAVLAVGARGSHWGH